MNNNAAAAAEQENWARRNNSMYIWRMQTFYLDIVMLLMPCYSYENWA